MTVPVSPVVPPEPAARKNRLATDAALLLALTLLVYAPAMRLGFVNFDDPGWTYANPAVQHGLCPASIRYAFTTVDMGSYNPLTWLDLETDVSLFGMHPLAFHAENVLLHAANTLLVLLILRRLSLPPPVPLLAAAMFGVHPLHVESVAWITERKDVLCAFFFLLAVLGHLRGSPLVVLWFVLSLLAKPMAVTLPAMLLVLDWAYPWRAAAGPLSLGDRVRVRGISGQATVSPAPNHPHPNPLRGGEGTRARRIIVFEQVVLWMLAMAASVGTILAQHASGEVVDTATLPLPARLANAAVAYGRYLVHVFWPVRLAAFYPLQRWSAANLIAATLVLLVMTTITLRDRRLLAGWLWFLGMLVPTIGLVQVGGQAMADRYAYLPMVGLLIAAGVAIGDRQRAWIHSIGWLLVALLSVLTVRQIGFWRDTQTLFTHSLAVTGPAALPHVQLAQDDVDRGRLADALTQYETAARLDPTYFVTQFDWANLLLPTDPAAAVAHYARAAALRPGQWKVENNWGLALLQLQQPHEAIPHFQRAIVADPTNPVPRHNLLLAQEAASERP